MRIPEVRTRLYQLSDVLREVAKELDALIPQLVRRPATKRAPRTSRRTTPKLKAVLRADALAHPNTPYQKIGERHGVNAGRVTDAVRGKRK